MGVNPFRSGILPILAGVMGGIAAYLVSLWVGRAPIGPHPSLSLGLLGTVMAAVGTVGGLLLGLMSLATLISLEDRLRAALQPVEEDLRRQTHEAAQTAIRTTERDMLHVELGIAAYSLYVQPLFENPSRDQLRIAEEQVTRILSRFDRMPLVRELFGSQLASIEVERIWHVALQGLADLVSPLVPDSPIANIARRWLEDAVAAAEQSGVDLLDPYRVFFHLAQMATLLHDGTQRDRWLHRPGSHAPAAGTWGPSIKDVVALCLYADPEEAVALCQTAGWPTQEPLEMLEQPPGALPTSWIVVASSPHPETATSVWAIRIQRFPKDWALLRWQKGGWDAVHREATASAFRDYLMTTCPVVLGSVPA
ncbi:MAG: hypothetical protein K6V97_03385 [Actinomycetia bacterium]|nr:hypothetical protein [Actinomycetes bacterium]